MERDKLTDFMEPHCLYDKVYPNLIRLRYIDPSYMPEFMVKGKMYTRRNGALILIASPDINRDTIETVRLTLNKDHTERDWSISNSKLKNGNYHVAPIDLCFPTQIFNLINKSPYITKFASSTYRTEKSTWLSDLLQG